MKKESEVEFVDPKMKGTVAKITAMYGGMAMTLHRELESCNCGARKAQIMRPCSEDCASLYTTIRVAGAEFPVKVAWIKPKASASTKIPALL